MKVFNKKGFTMAELLIVMAIVVLLAAIAVPTFGKQLETAREVSDMQGVRAIYEDVLSYAILDASDGKIDGSNGGTSLESGDTVTFSSSEKKYTVTVESAYPDFKVAQVVAGWQYVNNEIDGQPVDTSAGHKGVGISTKGVSAIAFSFDFEDNAVKLNGIETTVS